jgi:hypothetical protein
MVTSAVFVSGHPLVRFGFGFVVRRLPAVCGLAVSHLVAQGSTSVSGLRAEHGYEVGTKAMSRSPQTAWLGRFRAYPSRTPGSLVSSLLAGGALVHT